MKCGNRSSLLLISCALVDSVGKYCEFIPAKHDVFDESKAERGKALLDAFRSWNYKLHYAVSGTHPESHLSELLSVYDQTEVDQLQTETFPVSNQFSK